MKSRYFANSTKGLKNSVQISSSLRSKFNTVHSTLKHIPLHCQFHYKHISQTAHKLQGLIVTGSRDNTARVWEQNTNCDNTTPAANRYYTFIECFWNSGKLLLRDAVS